MTNLDSQDWMAFGQSICEKLSPSPGYANFTAGDDWWWERNPTEIDDEHRWWNSVDFKPWWVFKCRPFAFNTSAMTSAADCLVGASAWSEGLIASWRPQGEDARRGEQVGPHSTSVRLVQVPIVETLL